MFICGVKKTENHWSQTDVACYEYVLWWTTEVFKFCWHLTSTFDLGAVFVYLHNKIASNLQAAKCQILIQFYIV